MQYLVDTNVFSELARESPHAGVLANFNRHHAEIVCATITWHELRFGWERMAHGKKRDRVELFLDALRHALPPLIDFDIRAAEWLARERARLEASGKPISFVDGQIAACAVVNSLTLVTHNVKDFANFSGLRVANWHA